MDPAVAVKEGVDRLKLIVGEPGFDDGVESALLVKKHLEIR